MAFKSGSQFRPDTIGCPISKFELHHPIAIGSIFNVVYLRNRGGRLTQTLSKGECFNCNRIMKNWHFDAKFS